MKKKIHGVVLFCLKYFSVIFLHCFYLTWRYTITGLDKPYPKIIYVFWHRNILPMLLSRKYEQNVVIISASKDGDYIAEPAKIFGYLTVRGSSTRGGTSALREMIKYAGQHSLAFTPDGPKGPPQMMKEGALQLAYLTKLPVCAVRVRVSSAWIFRSWDKFIFPKPFAKIELEYSEPFLVHSKEDFRGQKAKIETYLNLYSLST